MLELKHHRTYYGANPYSVEPVIVVDLQVPRGIEAQIGRLCESFRAHYAEWFEQAEFKRSSPAVVLGQTASHWALCALNEVRGYLHAAGATPSPAGARVWLGFHDEAVSRAALKLAFNALLQAQKPDFPRDVVQNDLMQLWNACAERHPDFQAHVLMQAARANDVPVRPFVHATKFWQYGWGSRSRVFHENAPNDNGGTKLTDNKVLSKAIFEGLGAPTPTHRVVAKVEELQQAAESVGWPCVVKPVQENQGRGVTADISSLDQLRPAFDKARQATRGAVMMEAFVPGRDHRLVVAHGRFLCAIRREASFVVGDRTRTILQLLEALNKTRPVNLQKSGYLRPVAIDEVLLSHLAGQGVSLDTVPAQGARVTLRSNANLSTGGFATDVSAAVHPDTALMAELIAQSMGLVMAGLDFITADIGKSYEEMGAFIEVAANPGVDAMTAAGLDPVVFATQILGDKPGRIPLTLVVLTDDQLSEAERWLPSQAWPNQSAWACGRFAGVDGTPLKISQPFPWAAVDAVLKHQAVESLTIFCSDAQILRLGLPVDRVDRVVLCNVELPDEWTAVLSTNAARVERLSDWRLAATISGSAPGDRALEPNTVAAASNDSR